MRYEIVWHLNGLLNCVFVLVGGFFPFLCSDSLRNSIYLSVKVNIYFFNLVNSRIINNTDNHDLPICIAKTQYSLSDDPKKLGYPKDYEVIVRNIELHTGSGFIVVYLGSILTMPGLPKKPNYEQIDIDDEGNIVGIF